MTRIKLSLEKGDKLLTSKQSEAAGISYGCRRGACGKCIIKVTDDNEALNKKSEIEEMTLTVMGKNDIHHRLACQCSAKDAATIEVALLN